MFTHQILYNLLIYVRKEKHNFSPIIIRSFAFHSLFSSSDLSKCNIFNCGLWQSFAFLWQINWPIIYIEMDQFISSVKYMCIGIMTQFNSHVHHHSLLFSAFFLPTYQIVVISKS